MNNVNKLYDELKTYYEIYDAYFDLSKEMSEQDEDILCRSLQVQESKVINMLYNFLSGKVKENIIMSMLHKERDKLLSLTANLK